MIFDSNSVCSLAFSAEQEGESSSPYYEAELCVVLISSGFARIDCGKASIKVRAGTLALAPLGVSVLPQGECHYLAAGLSGSAALQLSANISELLVCDSSAAPMAPEIMRTICETERSRDISSLCYELLCCLARADEGKSAMPELVSAAAALMRKSYADLYGIEELSIQLGVSKSHLVRVFSHAMGIPPGKYLTQVRISAAKKLLAGRGYTLEVIASLCGFSGANYLCKVFRRETGCSCAEYRNAQRARIDDIDNKVLSRQENELFSF